MILGPTASGKSAAAMLLARHRPIEIISCDSAQVYRGLDIGTAKPDAIERQAVPHHLIDLIEPTDSYSAARFAHDVVALIPPILERNRLPVLVGGTMLYIKALTEGLHDLPGADPELRARLENEAREQGWPALHARLAELDPPTAARLKPTDAQRIQRALEICLVSGQPMSALLAPDRRQRPAHDLRFAGIALTPSDRSVLHDRIATRFQAMLADGLVDEVIALRKRGDLHAALPSMRSVGYRQVWAWLDAGGKSRDEAAMMAAGIAATRQLAKRQLTWLRGMPQACAIDCLAADAARHVSEAIDRLSA